MSNPRPISHYNMKPLIFFDKRTLQLLRTIKRSGDNGITWGELRKKYDDYANIFILEALTKELYIVTQDSGGNWLAFDTMDGNREMSYRSYTAARGNELLEVRCFNLWKWLVPTIISVVALVISILTAAKAIP